MIWLKPLTAYSLIALSLWFGADQAAQAAKPANCSYGSSCSPRPPTPKVVKYEPRSTNYTPARVPGPTTRVTTPRVPITRTHSYNLNPRITPVRVRSHFTAARVRRVRA